MLCSCSASCRMPTFCAHVAKAVEPAYSRGCSLPADWIEHALATHGEAYLLTPEDELSFVQRHNLDVIATFLLGAGAGLLVCWKLLQAAGAVLLAAPARSQKQKAI